ncbi:MAG: hypothetical protein ABFS46_00165 [Myxococcota bacterium]
MRPVSLGLAVVAAAVLLSLLPACRPKNTGPPSVTIDSPAHGEFVTGSQVTVTGTLSGSLGQIAELRINGLLVITFGQPNYSFPIGIGSSEIFKPIVVELTRLDGSVVRRRVTVLHGDSVADGGFSPMGVAMRLNDSGLDDVEPLVEGLVDFDVATLLPVGTLLILDYCAVRDPLFGFCVGWVDVYVANPPPGIGGFGLDVDAMVNQVAGDVSIQDLRVDMDVIGSGLAPSCGLRVTAATTTILGDYGLQPDAVDPSLIDVNQIGGVNVSFSQFQDEFTSGICDFPLLGDLVQLLLGDIEPTVRQGLEGFLNDPDGSGPQDGPIGDAIEVALAGIEISGPIGQAIGVNLETPLFDVFEDADGITLDSDARITASQPAAGAVDLLASYHIAEPFPTFGPNTPGGGLPYDLGLCISTSAFNQLLKAEVESGLLLSSLTELDVGFGLTPITAGFLASFIPAFGGLDPALPMRIDLAPTLGPVVTGAEGPQGELAELRIGHLLMSLVVDSSGFPLLEVAVDATVGLEIAFTNGELSFTPGPLSSNDVGVTILTNPLAANESPLRSLLLILIPQLFPTLADSLGSFPLPDFLGLQLDAVEVGKNGEFMSLFVDLSAGP